MAATPDPSSPASPSPLATSSAIQSGMGAMTFSSAPSFLVSRVPCIMSISARSPMLSFLASASARAFSAAAAALAAFMASVSYGPWLNSSGAT